MNRYGPLALLLLLPFQAGFSCDTGEENGGVDKVTTEASLNHTATLRGVVRFLEGAPTRRAVISVDSIATNGTRLSLCDSCAESDGMGAYRITLQLHAQTMQNIVVHARDQSTG